MTHKISCKMVRRWIVVPFGLLLMIVSACAAESKPADLSISIAVPNHDGQKTIQVGRQAKHFNVIIENLSEHRVNLWREWCSWGYFNLRFQFTDEKGTTRIANKNEKAWEKNFPDFVTVAPSEKLVIDVAFDPDIWDNELPPNAGRSTTVSMVAIYVSEDSKDAKEKGIWAGRLVSDKKEYTLVRWSE